MATETLRPNGAGFIAQFTIGGSSSAPTNWQSVDEAIADEDVTYVWTSSGTERDLYALPASSGSGTINSVTVHIRVKSADGETAPFALEKIKTYSIEYSRPYGSKIVPTTSYVNHSYQWATNPNTSLAWTWAEIDALQAGLEMGAEDSEGTVRCTQVYVEVDYTPQVDYERSLTTAMGMSATLSRAMTMARSLTTAVGLQASLETSGKNLGPWLCIASRDGGSVKTREGTAWSSCAKDASGDLLGAYFATYLNRLCVIRYQNTGFAYSPVNDIVSNWTDKPNFPNLPEKFTDLFVARDAGDDPVLYFLTPIGMYYLDVFHNFTFGPTELSWEFDDTAGKKGLYWKGSSYVTLGKGIYRVTGGTVDLIGPDMDDGLAEDMQGTITDMIGVGFWLVISIDGGSDNKSSILKRYITGKHWHTVYVGSTNTSISALFWDSGTLYFGEGTDVKSLPFSNKTENVAKLSTHTYTASGDLIYPYFHSEFEAMPKVAHKVRAVTRDCNASQKLTISYRKDEETTWTELGDFATSPRPDALPFPSSGDSIGITFERIQLKVAYAGGGSTNSPKLESLILEYRVTPPVLWGWDMRVQALTSGDQRGQDIIDALRTAIETGTLLSFYPSGDKSKTEYFVEVKGMPGGQSGTEFGVEGIYDLSLQEVID